MAEITLARPGLVLSNSASNLILVVKASAERRRIITAKKSLRNPRKTLKKHKSAADKCPRLPSNAQRYRDPTTREIYNTVAEIYYTNDLRYQRSTTRQTYLALRRRSEKRQQQPHAVARSMMSVLDVNEYRALRRLCSCKRVTTSFVPPFFHRTKTTINRDAFSEKISYLPHLVGPYRCSPTPSWNAAIMSQG